jgi:hypothetical protein
MQLHNLLLWCQFAHSAFNLSWEAMKHQQQLLLVVVEEMKQEHLLVLHSMKLSYSLA